MSCWHVVLIPVAFIDWSNKMAFESLGQGSVSDLGERYSSLEYGGQYFHPAADVKHYQPGWTSKIPIVFQIAPMCVNGEFFPSYRRSDGELKVTDFYMQMPEATFGSAEKMTMVLFNPFLERRGEYSARKNPFIMLRDKVRRVAHTTKEGEYLKGLFLGGKGQSAPLGAHGNRYFFNALVWQSTQGAEIDAKGRPMGAQDNDRWLPIVSGKNSFGKAIISLLQERIESGGEDILTGTQSLYFVGYNPESCEIRRWMSPDDVKAELEAMQQKQLASLQGTGEAGGDGGLVDVTTSTDDDDSNFQRYRVGVYKTCVIQTKVKEESEKPKRFLTPDRALRDYFSLIGKRIRPVSSVLVVPSHDDQVDMIARAFADKPDVLRIGFGETEYIRHPSVQKVLANAGVVKGAIGLGDNVPSGAGNLMTGGVSTPAPNANGLETVDDGELDDLFGEVTSGNADQHSDARSALRG